MATELVIDIGSGNITILQKGLGVVLKEPALAMVSTGKKPSLKATGIQAKKMTGKTVGSDLIVAPFKEGAIENFEVARLLLKDFVSKVTGERIFRKKITALVPISSGLSLSERRSYETLMERLGIEATIIDMPNVLSEFLPSKSGFVIHLGASLTEFAILSPTGIINANTLNIAGDELTNVIVNHLENKEEIKIGFYTAEKIKHAIASVYDNDTSCCDVTGRDFLGSPKTVQINAESILPAIKEKLDKIIEVARFLISILPPEMTEDAKNKGIYLSGGTAKLVGIREYVEQAVGLPVNVINDPINAVALGGERLMGDKKRIKAILNLKKI